MREYAGGSHATYRSYRRGSSHPRRHWINDRADWAIGRPARCPDARRFRAE